MFAVYLLCVLCATFTLEPDNGLCNTHDECAGDSSLSMSRPVYRLKASAVSVWHVLKHSSRRGSQLPPPWRLGALPTHTSESRKCQINTFKNSSYSPFETHICWEKVSTSSSSVSMSHQQPPAEPRLKAMLPLAESQHEFAFTWLNAITNRIQKLCPCILKSVQTSHGVLHIQTLCNSASHSKTVQID